MTNTTLPGKIDCSRMFRVRIDVAGKWGFVGLRGEMRQSMCTCGVWISNGFRKHIVWYTVKYLVYLQLYTEIQSRY
jgi:hypothetical protein